MDEIQGRFLLLLEQESALLNELYELLMEETTALKERNTEMISTLVGSKNNLLNKLGVLDKQRQLYMETEAPKLAFAENFEKRIKEMNSSIQTALDNCKHQNKINGGIIEVSQLFNNRILDIVRGQNAQESTYSAEGKNENNNSLNSIARV